MRTLNFVLAAALAVGIIAEYRACRAERPAPAGLARAASATVPAPRPPVRAEPPPPDEVKSAQLFDRNRGMASDPDLANEYDSINAEYFHNVLPAPAVRWESGLAELGPLIAEGFTVQGLTDGQEILLNPSIDHDRDQRRRALCHEMVHVAVWRQDAQHGPVFQDQLKQLALLGAFKGIVATDEEKDATLATIKQRRTELEVEERSLTGTRDALDRTSQAAVEAFNARVHRQQGAAAEYNRLVEQYNLMVSYPDGLARERLALRADGTSR